MGPDHRQPAGPHPGLLGSPVRSSRIARVRPRPQGADTRSPPARIPYIASRREGVRVMTQTLASANAAAAILAAAAERASRRMRDCLLSVRPPRHRKPRTKCRRQFPSSPATGRVPASTGKAAASIYPAEQITYADGHTRPTACPGGRPAAADTSKQPGLRKRLARRKTAPGPMDPAPARGAISGPLSSTPSQRNTQAITYWPTKVDTTQRMSNT